jgi:glycerol-3-phosphate dehydrogenase (NAD(P)+)
MSNKIAVIGAGSWGTALVRLIALNASLTVILYTRDEDMVKHINSHHHNPKHFPEVALPQNIIATNNCADLADYEIIVLAIPSQSIRGFLQFAKPHLKPNAQYLICAKGIEQTTNLPLSSVLKAELGNEINLAVLSGPNFASEVILDHPSATMIASHDLNFANQLAKILSTLTFRCYVTSDLNGVELIGALKNVIAIASGIALGLGYGENTKAMLISRAMSEIKRLFKVLAADEETLLSLAGIGDLILTCNSKESRNMRFGYALGQGENLNQALQNNTVEGYYTTQAIYNICQTHKVDAPIITTVYNVLFNHIKVEDAVTALLSRPLRLA